MKTLKLLEKSKTFWCILIFLIIFFLLRLPSVIEPNWYGDEAMYQVIGMALDKGELLYSQIWDNKPPLLYVTYAIFGGDQSALKFASLFVGLSATIVFFCLTLTLYKKKFPIAVLATSLFTLLFATPFLEGDIANAENFILLPIIFSALLIVYASEQGIAGKFRVNYLFLAAALLLGIAFLYKIVAVFDFTAFLTFLWVVHLSDKFAIKWKVLLMHSLLMLAVFSIPLMITIIYFQAHHALHDFMQATFFNNIGYVGYGNTFIIPQGLLLLKLLGLGIYLSLLVVKRKILTQTSLFILIWIGFSLFSTFFSQRPYTHYVLLLLPSFCLLAGLIFVVKNMMYTVIGLFLLVIVLVESTFHLGNFEKTFLYYPNALLYVLGKKSVSAYQAFFDPTTPRDYAVAAFINKHATAADQIFVWGDHPEIYALTKKLPPGKYTVAYHIRQNKDGMENTQNAINTIEPKYVIMLREAPRLPIDIPFYTNQFTVQGATIYEKNL